MYDSNSISIDHGFSDLTIPDLISRQVQRSGTTGYQIAYKFQSKEMALFAYTCLLVNRSSANVSALCSFIRDFNFNLIILTVFHAPYKKYAFVLTQE